jgi:hypothetical protein
MRTPKPATPPSQIVLAPFAGAGSSLMIVSVSSCAIALAYCVSVSSVSPWHAYFRQLPRKPVGRQGISVDFQVSSNRQIPVSFKGLVKGANAGLHPEGREFETLRAHQRNQGLGEYPGFATSSKIVFGWCGYNHG